MSRMTTGARPRLISSQSSTRGLDISARPIATICCWPPESDVRRIAAPLPQHGEQRVDAFRASTAPPTLRPCAPISRFSSTLSDGNSLRPSGTMAMPSASMSGAGSAPIGAPSRRIDAGRIVQHAGNRPHQRRLAGTIGADDGDGLARAQRDVDAEQRLEIAIVGGRVLWVSSSAIRPRSPDRFRAPRWRP